MMRARREREWWSLPVVLTMVCLGYQTAAFQYPAANVSFEMPLALTHTDDMLPSTQVPTLSFAPEPEMDGCCKGTLGYASANYILPFPCAKSRCCDDRETVAVIPVDQALGFQFACIARSSVRTLCYQAGSEVYSSNEDPDYVPRMCCAGGRFSVLLNRWYAAMIIKCVEEGEDYHR